MQYEAILGPEEVLPQKPFTDAANTAREADVMREMLEHERRRARKWARAGLEAAVEHVVRESDEDGHRHLLVVPDTHRLLESRDLTAVGFFARPRADVDHGILFELEDELVSRMGAYGEAGLLSYYDVELVKGAYGNLILFGAPEIPEEWYRDVVHRRAVEVSPSHYFEVRLHKGSIPGALLDGGDITIERTKYFDFANGATWRGLRRFG
jgi:hypothetical protein